MDLLMCRICGHGLVESLGKIPDCGEFAGQPVSPPIKGGDLWVCKMCGSMFRHPTLSASDYIALYEKAPATVWVESGIERNDFSTILTYLKDHAGGSILDVGCYTGNFLAGLPDNFRKFGVEPSDLASQSAATNGIEVLGKTLDELDSDQHFDVVVSIDVIEHVLDVEKFLDQALAHVAENGLLIISTGNPDTFSWKKVFKSRFWYNSFAEHVTFPSYKYYDQFSRRHGLQPPEQIRFRYMKLKYKARLVMLFRYVLCIFFPGLYRALKNIRSGTMDGTGKISPVVPEIPIGVFTDHHAIIFRRGSQQC